MPLVPRIVAAAAALLILVSCGERPGYQDHVQLLPDEQANPMLLELLPLFGKPAGRDPDDLVRTWKAFLGDTPVPLRQEAVVTFVYYDFSGTRSKVWLEASFAPNRREPLTKVPGVGLFYKVYDIPHIDQVQYRFSDGTAPLHDPFNAAVKIDSDSWHAAADPSQANELWITGAADSTLGKDIRVVLPPQYQRQLALSYPLAVVSGLDGWATAVAQVLASGTVKPFITVAALDDTTLAWLQTHYRLSKAAPFKWQGNVPEALAAALKTQFPQDNP